MLYIPNLADECRRKLALSRRHGLTSYHRNGPSTTEYPGVLLSERMLTVSEAALMLSAHPNSVRRWADLGLLPAYRIGQRGDRRFKLEDISRFLESCKSA